MKITDILLSSTPAQLQSFLATHLVPGAFADAQTFHYSLVPVLALPAGGAIIGFVFNQ